MSYYGHITGLCKNGHLNHESVDSWNEHPTKANCKCRVCEAKISWLHEYEISSGIPSVSINYDQFFVKKDKDGNSIYLHPTPEELEKAKLYWLPGKEKWVTEEVYNRELTDYDNYAVSNYIAKQDGDYIDPEEHFCKECNGDNCKKCPFVGMVE